MAVNPDFRDLFKKFNDHRVEYLVIGAYALIYYTTPRYTKDIDIWVNPTPRNASKVWRALHEFGAPMRSLTEKDFTDKKMVYQIGIEPNRIDIIMGISGMKFSSAWKNRKRITYGGIPAMMIGKRDLIRSKISTGRPQDMLDVEQLKKK